MSLSRTLKTSMARSLDAVFSIFQYLVLIAGLFFVLGILGDVFNEQDLQGETESVAPIHAVAGVSAGLPQEVPGNGQVSAELKPYHAGVLDYVKRRYRVSPEAVMPVFEVAELIGKERRIDPLLILAIIGVESSFNPFAESTMGARGLMQVIPRFHMDKMPVGAGSRHLFDPAVNIQVGVQVLEEAIRRAGDLTAALQHYAGSSDPLAGYANKVLAEKARLEKAARRNAASSA